MRRRGENPRWNALYDEVSWMNRGVGLALSPSVADIASRVAQVAPQLTLRQSHLLCRRAAQSPQHVIGPPLRIHGAAYLYKVEAEGGQLLLSFQGVLRRAVSYCGPLAREAVAKLDADLIKKLSCLADCEAAEEYACQTWPEELAWDTAATLMQYRLPATGHVAAALLGVSRNELLRHDAEPWSELVNDAILEAEAAPAVRWELQGSYAAGITNYACPGCGAGDWRYATACRHCGMALMEDPGGLMEYPGGFTRAIVANRLAAALPQKVIDAFCRAGHEFLLDPLQARAREHLEWAQRQLKQFKQPAVAAARTRVITL